MNENTIIIARWIPESGKIHQGQEVYFVCGISPTIRSETHGKLPMVSTNELLRIKDGTNRGSKESPEGI